MSIKFKFHYNLTIKTAALYKDRCTFIIISCSALLRMGNVSDGSCRENQNTHFVFSKFFFYFSENRAVYKIMLKNSV